MGIIIIFSNYQKYDLGITLCNERVTRVHAAQLRILKDVNYWVFLQ